MSVRVRACACVTGGAQSLPWTRMSAFTRGPLGSNGSVACGGWGVCKPALSSVTSWAGARAAKTPGAEETKEVPVLSLSLWEGGREGRRWCRKGREGLVSVVPGTRPARPGETSREPHGPDSPPSHRSACVAPNGDRAGAEAMRSGRGSPPPVPVRADGRTRSCYGAASPTPKVTHP